MKKFTIEDLRSFDPCYDPNKYLPEDWEGTALDILKKEEIPVDDQLWAVLRDGFISDKTLRLFAVWSYRETLKFINNPDPRSLKAAEVAEAYALGKATMAELTAARSSAQSATDSVTDSVTWSACAARDCATDSATGSAARSARCAARSAARFATWSDWSDARSARFAARSATWSAWSDARSAQRKKLIEMLEEELNAE